MKHKKRLLIDCDGVLSNFTKSFLKIANRICGTNHVEADMWNLEDLPGLKEHSKEIWAEVGKPGFATDMKVLPGAPEGMETMAALGEIFVVTAPLWMNDEDETKGPFIDGMSYYAKTFCHERMQWLWNHFGIGRKNIVFAYHKNIAAGDVLIDDKLENVRAWIDEHGEPVGVPFTKRAILWAQPWNVAGIHDPRVIRTNDWTMAAEVIRACDVGP